MGWTIGEGGAGGGPWGRGGPWGGGSQWYGSGPLGGGGPRGGWSLRWRWSLSRLRGTRQNYGMVSCVFYKGFSVSFGGSPQKNMRILAAYPWGGLVPEVGVVHEVGVVPEVKRGSLRCGWSQRGEAFRTQTAQRKQKSQEEEENLTLPMT